VRKCVFLDRDGVLIEDVGLLTRPDQARLIDGAARAVAALRRAGFAVVVVSNQAVVARGLCGEEDVKRVNETIDRALLDSGGSGVTAFYFCPHHPNATVPAYRADCRCRKPASGMLSQAADDLQLDLAQSYMVGDRMTDILAGRGAHCTTILVESGRHEEPPIETANPIDLACKPDRVCADLREAARWILGRAE